MKNIPFKIELAHPRADVTRKILSEGFDTNCWEPWISPFPYLGLYRCMQNYLRPLDPKQQKQKTNFYNSKIKRKTIRELYLWFGCSQINSTRWRWRTMNMEVSYTQDLSLDDLNHDLDTPKCRLWKGWSLGSYYLSLSLEVEDKVSFKVMNTLAPIGYL